MSKLYVIAFSNAKSIKRQIRTAVDVLNNVHYSLHTMCVCFCACTHVLVYVFVRECRPMCLCSLCVHFSCLWVFIYVCMCVFVCVCMCVFVCVFMFVCLCGSEVAVRVFISELDYVTV